MNDMEMICLATKLGEVKAKETGQTYEPHRLFVIFDASGSMMGAVVVWLSQRVTFAKYDADTETLVSFAEDNMENISDLSEDDTTYDNPLALFRAKSAVAGFNLLVTRSHHIEI